MELWRGWSHAETGSVHVYYRDRYRVSGVLRFRLRARGKGIEGPGASESLEFHVFEVETLEALRHEGGLVPHQMQRLPPLKLDARLHEHIKYCV